MSIAMSNRLSLCWHSRINNGISTYFFGHIFTFYLSKALLCPKWLTYLLFLCPSTCLGYSLPIVALSLTVFRPELTSHLRSHFLNSSHPSLNSRIPPCSIKNSQTSAVQCRSLNFLHVHFLLFAN